MVARNYDEWIKEKKSKEDLKTSDDTFTPEDVYNVVKNFVFKEYNLPAGTRVERPFFPGGDYQKAAEDYDENTVVIDNPPFSILSKIVRFYCDKNVKFFIFGPALTGSNYGEDLEIILPGESITYENDVQVATLFLSNIVPEKNLKLRNKLGNEIKKQKSQQKKRKKSLTLAYKGVTTTARLHHHNLNKTEPYENTKVQFIKTETKSTKKPEVFGTPFKVSQSFLDYYKRKQELRKELRKEPDYIVIPKE